MDPTELLAAVHRGIDLCRKGQVEEGYALLDGVAHEGVPENVPSQYWAFWGYGMAAVDARYNDGIAACKKALELEFYQPENSWNLARTYLLLGSRRQAIAAVRQGLSIDGSYRPLLQLQRELGQRRPPVLTFLRRDHAINRLLGRIRHDAEGSGRRRT